ncbi:hypothetical protein ACHAPT_003854 [Fusarium lateritium]
MFPGGGHGHLSQHPGSYYDPHDRGGSRGRGRRRRRRGGGRQGGWEAFPLAQGQAVYGEGQYGYQVGWQYAYQGGTWGGDAMTGLEMEASELREQLQQCQEALRSKEEDLALMRITLAERGEIIAQQSNKIRSAEAELLSTKESKNRRTEMMNRTIADMRRKLGSARNDADQLIAQLNLAKEAAAAKDELIARQSAELQTLQKMLRDYKHRVPMSSTQHAAFSNGHATELPAELGERLQALDTIARWEDFLQFVDDDEFSAGAIKEVGAILDEAQLRGKLYEFLMESALDTWSCLSRVCKHGVLAEAVPHTDSPRCPTHDGNPSCRLVMVTVVNSGRCLRFFNRRS